MPGEATSKAWVINVTASRSGIRARSLLNTKVFITDRKAGYTGLTSSYPHHSLVLEVKLIDIPIGKIVERRGF